MKLWIKFRGLKNIEDNISLVLKRTYNCFSYDTKKYLKKENDFICFFMNIDIKKINILDIYESIYLINLNCLEVKKLELKLKLKKIMDNIIDIKDEIDMSKGDIEFLEDCIIICEVWEEREKQGILNISLDEDKLLYQRYKSCLLNVELKKNKKQVEDLEKRLKKLENSLVELKKKEIKKLNNKINYLKKNFKKLKNLIKRKKKIKSKISELIKKKEICLFNIEVYEDIIIYWEHYNNLLELKINDKNYKLTEIEKLKKKLKKNQNYIIKIKKILEKKNIYLYNLKKKIEYYKVLL